MHEVNEIRLLEQLLTSYTTACVCDRERSKVASARQDNSMQRMISCRLACRLACRLVFAAALCLAPAVEQATAGGQSSIELRYSQLDNLINSPVELQKDNFSARVGHTFSSLFGDEYTEDRLLLRAEQDLYFLFKAASIASFFGYEDATVFMAAAFDRWQEYSDPPSWAAVDLFDAYIRERRFQDAAEFKLRHYDRGMEFIPLLVDERPDDWSGPAVIHVGRSSEFASLRAVPFAEGGSIIVIFHPSCHFSVGAFEAIAADPVLAPVFIERARWVAPAYDKLRVNMIREWNESRPGQHVDIAYDRAGWGFITRWETPTFYFLSNGSVTRVIQGWPSNHQLETLRDATRSVGLIDSD